MLNKELCREYILARNTEKAAKEYRLSLERKLVEAFGASKAEGTETKATDGFKVSVTSKLNRALDIDAYQALNLPDNMSFVDFKPSINLKNLRMAERIDPISVAKCITTKPGKPSIKIEEVV